MAGVLDFLGPIGSFLGGATQEQPEQLPGVSRIGSAPQMRLFEQLLRAARTGSGEYGFGAASRSGMSTLRQQMGNMGQQPGSPVYNSTLAQLLAGTGAQDMAGRRAFAMQMAQARPWVETAQRFEGQPWTGSGRVRNTNNRYADNAWFRHYAPRALEGFNRMGEGGY